MLSATILNAAQTISMPEAIELLKRNNSNIRQAQEQQLLLDSKASLHNYRFSPKLSPIELDVNAKNKTTDLTGGVQWQLPSGAQLQLNYKQRFNEDPHGSISIKQPITHNRVHLDASIKQNQIQISILEQQQRYEQTVLKMRQAYYTSVVDQLLLEHQRNRVEDIRQQIQHNEILYKHGEIARVELDKMLNLLEKEAISLLKNEQKAELNLIELKRLLGIPLQTNIRVDQTITFKETHFDPTETLAQAFRYNIPFQIERLRLENAHYQYQISKTLSLPEVSVYGSMDDQENMNAGLRVKLTPPSGETHYQETANMLNHQQAQQNYRDKDTNLRLNLHRKLVELENQAALVNLSAKSLQQQQSIYQAESLKFQYQQISLEAFQKTAVQLQSAYQESIQAQIRYSHLRDELLQMTGSLHEVTQTTEKAHVQD